MKRLNFVTTLMLLVSCAAVTYGQTPAAPPVAAPKPATSTTAPATGAPARFAVVDFNQALIENVEGKAAYQTFQTAVGEKQKAMDAEAKSGEELQTKLKTQSLSLSDEAKTSLTKQIETINTHLTRMNEDDEQELGELKQKLFAPIAGRVNEIIGTYAKEMGFMLVYDESNQGNSLVYIDPIADITTEVIRRVDADIAKNPTRPKPQTPPSQRPSGAPAPAPNKPNAPPAPNL